MWRQNLRARALTLLSVVAVTAIVFWLCASIGYGAVKLYRYLTAPVASAAQTEAVGQNPVTAKNSAPKTRITLTQPKDPASLPWLFVQCNQGKREACATFARTVLALEQGGSEVQLCVVWGVDHKAHCLDYDVETP